MFTLVLMSSLTLQIIKREEKTKLEVIEGEGNGNMKEMMEKWLLKMVFKTK